MPPQVHDDDDLPDRPEWGDVSPSIGADLLAAARRREDLRAVALAYRYAERFTGDDVLRTAIAANALRQRRPSLSRREAMQQVVELIAYASRAYSTWLNQPAAVRLALEEPLGIDRIRWVEPLRLRAMGIESPD
jgi:hypothetical protein